MIEAPKEADQPYMSGREFLRQPKGAAAGVVLAVLIQLIYGKDEKRPSAKRMISKTF